MSLDICLEQESSSLYEANITSNLGGMARHAGLYEVLWRPGEMFDTPTAKDLIDGLKAGLATLVADPERFRKFNPSNGWGSYEGLVQFTTEYLSACIEHPNAAVRVWY